MNIELYLVLSTHGSRFGAGYLLCSVEVWVNEKRLLYLLVSIGCVVSYYTTTIIEGIRSYAFIIVGYMK